MSDEDKDPRWSGGVTLRLDERLRSEIAVARPAKAGRPTLVVLTGNHVGVRKKLSGTALVGRDPAADLVLTDASVSWRHARVEDRGDTWAVVDLGSTNGTQHNGARCGEARLTPGDRVTFGATVVRFEVLDDIDQQYDAAVDRMINHDDLTGLLRKSRFDVEIHMLLEAARLRGEALGLLVMDLDGVKHVNDNHGHLAGQLVIGDTGKILSNVIGTRGIAARFGGDEFVAALPGHDIDAAARIAEQVRATIEQHTFVREGVRFQVRISIGVAVYPRHGGEPDELFRIADAALYRAKQSGRNRVVVG